MGYIAYSTLFHEQAMAETRELTFSRRPPIPDDSYGLVEFYCPDPKCDCQMVVIFVISKRSKQQVASFVYFFNPDDAEPGMPNPSLAYTTQSPYARALLNQFADHLHEDPAYEKRLRRHYQQVKTAIGDPAHPAHANYLEWKAWADAEAKAGRFTWNATPRRTARKLTIRKKTAAEPAKTQSNDVDIIAITDRFCAEHLTDEYRDLCRKMIAALGRKRPSPLSKGTPNVWAAAVVYALGQVNFLFDKTQTPYMSREEVCAAFGITKSAAGKKAGQIRELLDIAVMDPAWFRRSQLDQNPVAWMIMVNGFMVDARTATRDIQAEAYRKGLIPYIPE